MVGRTDLRAEIAAHDATTANLHRQTDRVRLLKASELSKRVALGRCEEKLAAWKWKKIAELNHAESEGWRIRCHAIQAFALKATDAYTAAEDRGDGSYPLWDDAGLVNALVALRGLLA